MTTNGAAGDFGNKLRAARERRGISLRQIASATKISVSALEALERNDISRLPGGIFSRAFVRSYASEVGLDPDEMIQEFLAQFSHDTSEATHAPPEAIEDHDSIESDRRTASTFLRLVAVSVPIAAAVVYFGMSGRTVAPPRPMEPAAAAAPAVSPAPPVVVPAAPPRANDPAAVRQSARPASVRRAAVIAAPAPAAFASDEAKPNEISRLTVALSVTRPCWLSATVDGEKKIERLLQAGERQTIEVTRELSFTAGDASAVKMTINGADAKRLGKEGEVVTARINLSNFKSYLPSR